MTRYTSAEVISKMTRRWFSGAAAAGVAALLTLQMPATAAPVGSEPAALADAYAKHLRATKGIMDIRTIHQSGLGPHGLNLVVVSAGFTAKEMDAFHGLCRQLTQSIFSVQPWSRYTNAVNVHAVFVADKSVGETRLRVHGYDGHVLGCDDGIAVEYARYAADSATAVVLHNSAYSIAANGTWGVDVINKNDAYNPGAPVHELGHALAGLGDEYIQRSGPFDETPESLQDTVNVTAEPNPRLCKWHYWTEEEWPGLFKPLKRPAGRAVGNFEGAGWPTKIYRPEETCMMRGDRNEFCLVCNESLEASFFRYMDLFKTVEPERENMVLWKGESFDCRVSAVDLVRKPPAWLASHLDLYLDGKRVASSDRGEVAFHLAGKTAAPGVHHLGANLNVELDSVRRDFGFLSASRAWRVKVIPHAKPGIAVKPLVSIASDGVIEVPVAIRHANPALFGLKMACAPTNAVLENGRFKWKPDGATGSWRVDFTAAFEQEDVVTESMEIRVTRADGAEGAVGLKGPEAIDAVTGEPVVARLQAGAKDGGHILFEPLDVPAGAGLNRYTGELTWTPLMSQAGPRLMRFRVSSGPAALETNILFRVRRAAAPNPISYCNTYVPQTLEYLKQLQQSPLVYRRIFETLRLLRDRYARIYEPALAEAAKMHAELGPELQASCIQELSLRAWAFTDKPGIIQWMRRIAEAGKSEEAHRLLRKLDLMAELDAVRKVETSGVPADLTPLTAKLVKTSDEWIRSSIERAAAAICTRAEDKAACQQAILAALAKAKGPERATLLPLLPLVRTPAAMEALTAAAMDPDKDVAAKAVKIIEAAGGLAQLVPLATLLAETSREAVRFAIERAAAAICRRVEDKEVCQQVILPVLAKAKGPARAALVRLLPLVKTPAAMEAWTTASSDPDKEVAGAARQALGYLKGLGVTEGYIASWMLSGPYVASNSGSCIDVAFAPEKKDGKAEWQPYTSKAEKGARIVPLDKIFGGDNRAAYMQAVIRSDKAQEVLFEAGSDDGIKVWLNGAVIHANNAMRPLKPRDDTFKGKLNVGDNVLLCKIIQHTGGWAACVRIRSADGGDALGVSVAGVSE